jgi:hypothetical protein
MDAPFFTLVAKGRFNGCKFDAYYLPLNDSKVLFCWERSEFFARTTGHCFQFLWCQDVASNNLNLFKARTGLLLARSTGLLVAACFSEFAVADLHNLADSVSYHFSHSSFFLRMFWVIKLGLTDEATIERLSLRNIQIHS